MKRNFFIRSLFFVCLSLIVVTEVLAAATIPKEINQAIINDMRSYAAIDTNHSFIAVF